MPVNNITEKEYRDQQTMFGHIGSAKDVIAWLRDTYSEGTLKEKRYRKVAYRFLDTATPYQVLEVAAGVGDFTMFCTKLFPQHSYTANELSQVQLATNISKVAEFFGVNKLPRMSFGPVESLDLSSTSFDVIFVKASLHHFEDPRKALTEFYRVLKPGGRVVFVEDPLCLDIPFYTTWRKNNNCKAERAMGINENIYTMKEYKSFGSNFDHIEHYLDEVLVAEFDQQQSARSGLKKIAGLLLRKFIPIFEMYMIWRFTSPVVFVFTK